MKVVVIGGTGLIGSRLVARVREHGHQPVPASPDTQCLEFLKRIANDATGGDRVRRVKQHSER